MLVFKTSYEELYHKYRLFAEMDFEGSGRVKLKDNADIGVFTKIALTHIIKEYYRPFDN